VPDVVDELVARGATVVVAGAPGGGDEEVVPPPRGHWLADPLAGDGRAGAFGAASLLIHALADVPIDRVALGLEAARAACASTSYADHPAYNQALVAALCEADLARASGAHLATDPRLLPLARWAGRVWGATMVEERAADTMRARLGGRMVDGVIGDEELWEQLVAGPADIALTLWELQAAADPLGQLAGRQLGALVRHAQDRGLPVTRVRLADLDAANVATAMALTLHASAAAARLLDRDPSTLVSLRWLYAALDVDASTDAE
jgi:hypothetical protein